nr:TetR/AcrR family transcriptional regulator [Conexibacter arvalis]
MLDAGYDLVGTGGAAQLTVRGVCRAARLTERYFYESFADREELLLAVHTRTAAEARDAIAAAVAAAPPEPVAVATAAVDAFVDLLQDDPRRGRVLLTEVFADERLTRAGVELIPSFAALLVEQIRAIYGDGAEGGPDAVDAQVTSVALVGALAHLFTGWLDGTLSISRERLVAHVVRLILAAAPVSSRDA